jgi:hypothetical protein
MPTMDDSSHAGSTQSQQRSVGNVLSAWGLQASNKGHQQFFSTSQEGSQTASFPRQTLEKFENPSNSVSLGVTLAAQIRQDVAQILTEEMVGAKEFMQQEMAASVKAIQESVAAERNSMQGTKQADLAKVQHDLTVNAIAAAGTATIQEMRRLFAAQEKSIREMAGSLQDSLQDRQSSRQAVFNGEDTTGSLQDRQSSRQSSNENAPQAQDVFTPVLAFSWDKGADNVGSTTSQDEKKLPEPPPGAGAAVKKKGSGARPSFDEEEFIGYNFIDANSASPKPMPCRSDTGITAEISTVVDDRLDASHDHVPVPAVKESSSFASVFFFDTNLDKPAYHAEDFYKTSGPWQAIARSPKFSSVSVFVVALNAIYLGVDSDHNDGANVYDSDWPWLLISQLFAIFLLGSFGSASWLFKARTIASRMVGSNLI